VCLVGARDSTTLFYLLVSSSCSVSLLCYCECGIALKGSGLSCCKEAF